MRQPFNPDVEILHYCEHICNAHIQTVRMNHKTGTWFWDYPAMAAICYNHDCLIKRASYSHRPQNGEFHQALEYRLLTLGVIGRTPQLPGKRYPLGNCAEQHAASNYMKHLGVNNLNDLYFSKAMRPRTKEVFNYCDNCKDIFPNI